MAMPHKVLDAPHPHYMNKQREKHMLGTPSQDVSGETGQHTPPHIHLEPRGGRIGVHIEHADGRTEDHEHDFGDLDGLKSHIDKHYGQGFQGQGHGIKQEGADEDELSASF